MSSQINYYKDLADQATRMVFGQNNDFSLLTNYDTKNVINKFYKDEYGFQILKFNKKHYYLPFHNIGTYITSSANDGANTIIETSDHDVDSVKRFFGLSEKNIQKVGLSDWQYCNDTPVNESVYVINLKNERVRKNKEFYLNSIERWTKHDFFDKRPYFNTLEKINKAVPYIRGGLGVLAASALAYGYTKRNEIAEFFTGKNT